MVLVQKLQFFKSSFFRQNRLGKYPLRYSRTRKRLSRLQKPEVQKVEKLTFFQRGYSMVFFLGNVD